MIYRKKLMFPSNVKGQGMDPTKPRPWVPNVVLDTRQDPESRQAATAATAQPRPLQPRPSLAVQQNQADM